MSHYFTCHTIISSPSSSCTSLLYSFLTIPNSHALLQCLPSLPLLYSPLNPFIPFTLYLSLFFCSPLLPPHSFSLSLYHTLYSIPTPHSPSLPLFIPTPHSPSLLSFSFYNFPSFSFFFLFLLLIPPLSSLSQLIFSNGTIKKKSRAIALRFLCGDVLDDANEGVATNNLRLQPSIICMPFDVRLPWYQNLQLCGLG